MKTDRLEQAIHDAVATTAAPEDARLAIILARLEQVPVARPAPRRSAWPWLLLAAAGAAAAGGGYWYAHRSGAPITPQPPQPAIEKHLPLDDRPMAPTVPTTPTENAHTASQTDDGKATVIYRR